MAPDLRHLVIWLGSGREAHLAIDCAVIRRLDLAPGHLVSYCELCTCGERVPRRRLVVLVVVRSDGDLRLRIKAWRVLADKQLRRVHWRRMLLYATWEHAI